MRRINRLGEEPANPLLASRSCVRIRKGGKVAYRGRLRLLEARAVEERLPKVAVLEAIDAAKPGQWKMPFRVGVAALVYGPEGLNPRQVREFLATDDDLIAQLADYAEKTAQTEALISAIASGTPLNPTQVDAALNGMGTQAGVGAIDRTTLRINRWPSCWASSISLLEAGVDPVAPTSRFARRRLPRRCGNHRGMFLGGHRWESPQAALCSNVECGP